MLTNDLNPPGNSWNSLFNNISEQGSAFNIPISPSGWYYAFLSSVEQDWESQKYVVLFEVVPQEWVDNAIMNGDALISALAPVSPASCYFLNQVDGTTLMNMLGLKSEDDLAEGSWYLIQLEKATSGPLLGDLYNPDIDMEPESKILL